MNGTSVAEIFENFGESVFREKEVLLLHFFFLLTISHIADSTLSLLCLFVLCVSLMLISSHGCYFSRPRH